MLIRHSGTLYSCLMFLPGKCVVLVSEPATVDGVVGAAVVVVVVVTVLVVVVVVVVVAVVGAGFGGSIK